MRIPGHTAAAATVALGIKRRRGEQRAEEEESGHLIIDEEYVYMRAMFEEDTSIDQLMEGAEFMQHSRADREDINVKLMKISKDHIKSSMGNFHNFTCERSRGYCTSRLKKYIKRNL